MKDNSALVLIVAILISFNAAVLGTTAYVVFWLGYSGWWFLLALLLMSGASNVKSKAQRERSDEG